MFAPFLVLPPIFPRRPFRPHLPPTLGAVARFGARHVLVAAVPQAFYYRPVQTFFKVGMEVAKALSTDSPPKEQVF